jgi:hypothetical protein
MHISLPVDNKAATLAQDMVPPSNWNPDRRNSLGKASPSPNRKKPPSSPSLTAQGHPSDLSPTAEDKKEEEEEGKEDSEEGKEEEEEEEVFTTPPMFMSSSSSSHSVSDDLLTKTIEEIGIDSSKCNMDNRDSPSSKRQSMEIPVKKAKCSRDSPERQSQQLLTLEAATEKMDSSPHKEDCCEKVENHLPGKGDCVDKMDHSPNKGDCADSDKENTDNECKELTVSGVVLDGASSAQSSDSFHSIAPCDDSRSSSNV